jgi:type II secretory pathway pseudopilin PulG
MHIHRRRTAEGGYSLVELLVVISTMLFILAAVSKLLRDSINISNTTYEMTDAQQNLRTAQEYINRDLLHAGDGLDGINNIQVPQAFVLAYLARNVVNDPLKPGYVNLPLVASDSTVPANIAVLGSAPAVTVLTNTDRLTMLALDRTFTPTIAIPAGFITGLGATISLLPADAARLTVGEVYCFTSASGAAFGAITAMAPVGARVNVSFAVANSYSLNNPVATGPLNRVGAGNGAGTSTQAVSMMRVKIIHYYVNSKKEFVKRVFGVAGSGFSDSLIAEHITNLKFRYLLAPTATGGVVQQPIAQLTDNDQQIRVRQIETSMTAETTHPVRYNSTARHETTMLTVTAIRDLQFRLAQQPQP